MLKISVAHDGGVNVEKTARLEQVELLPVIVERFGARGALRRPSQPRLRKIGVTDPILLPK